MISRDSCASYTNVLMRFYRQSNQSFTRRDQTTKICWFTENDGTFPIVRNYKFRRGQKVIAIGNPGGIGGKILENAVCEGILSTQTEVDDQPYYQLSIAINHGNSGGPILDDAGNAIGIATLKMLKNEAIGYCIPPEALLNAIETLWRSDSDKIRQTNEQHYRSISLNRGLGKLTIVLQLPGSVLEPPSEKLHELIRSALLDFDKAARQLPNDVRVFVCRALIKVMLSDWTEALADLNEAVRLEPNEQAILDFRNAVQQEVGQQRPIAGGRSGAPFSSMTMPDVHRLRPPGPLRPPGRRP